METVIDYLATQILSAYQEISTKCMYNAKNNQWRVKLGSISFDLVYGLRSLDCALCRNLGANVEQYFSLPGPAGWPTFLQQCPGK